MSQLFSTNLDKVPLFVQSKVAVNIVRPAENRVFTLVSQGSYLFLLVLRSKEDNIIPKNGRKAHRAIPSALFGDNIVFF